MSDADPFGSPRGGRVSTSIEAFSRQAGRRLEQALVARFGLEVGRDAAAEAIAYAVEHWDDLVEVTNLVGYLYRVGQTAARRLHRWQRPDVIVAAPVTTDEPIDVDLQVALMQLSVEQRVAVLLVHSFGHTYREVADVLDTTTTNVNNHVRRGLANLRELME
jgi:DNA-directed RNA polymerase specialized sigma24 family protein